MWTVLTNIRSITMVFMVGGIQPSVEKHLVEDALWLKMTFSRRRPWVEDDLQWKTTFSGSLYAAYSAFQHFFLI